MTSTPLGQPVVVGIDGSTSALDAARWAADEAARRGLPLRLVTAVDTTATIAFGGRLGRPEDFVQEVETQARDWLVTAEKAVAQAHPGLTVEQRLTTQQAAIPALVDESAHARLVVLGSRGLGGFTGLLAGSTAVALVAHGHSPVVVVRGPRHDEPAPADGPVVVGVDGSPASESAVALAFEEASIRHAELVAVHTWIEFASDSAYAYARQFMMDWTAVEQRESERLAERLAGWQEKYPDVTVRRVVTRDRPVRCLLEQAEHAQLLIVGSRGHGRVSGTLLGSTSQALIYHAPCPLLVARPPAAPAG